MQVNASNNDCNHAFKQLEKNNDDFISNQTSVLIM